MRYGLSSSFPKHFVTVRTNENIGYDTFIHSRDQFDGETAGRERNVRCNALRYRWRFRWWVWHWALDGIARGWFCAKERTGVGGMWARDGYRGWIQKEWNNGLGCGQLAVFQPILSRPDATGSVLCIPFSRLIFVESPRDASHSESYFSVGSPPRETRAKGRWRG